ncbi:MAG: hypothetical protein MZU97_22965 [Bacillus subtilis]|nr:hypothetical protein [Bacillus subtilis]
MRRHRDRDDRRRRAFDGGTKAIPVGTVCIAIGYKELFRHDGNPASHGHAKRNSKSRQWKRRSLSSIQIILGSVVMSKK